MHHRDIKASIIVPAYNAERWIERALTSALAQTEQRCEVIVIDDASEDATREIVMSIAGTDPRIHLLRNSDNLGPAGARNRGLSVAVGDWIALLDADDRFVPQRIASLIELGDQHGADFVADNLLLCPEDGKQAPEPMISSHALPAGKFLSAAEFIAGNVGNRWTPRVSYGFLQPIMRRSFLRRNGIWYDERNRFGEDFMLYTASLIKGARWWITPDATYLYSVRPGSLTDVQSAADLHRIRTMEEALLRDESLVPPGSDLAAALRRHKRLIDRFYYYRAFTDALKARTTASALKILFASAGAFRHICLESTLRAPTVLTKALRGGYRGNA